jgi:hypothetical protein
VSCIVIEKPIIEIIQRRAEVNLSPTTRREIKLVPTGVPGPPGLSGSLVTVVGETPVGVINGSNATFHTQFAFVPESVEVFVNGLALRRPEHFNTSGPSTITLSDAPSSGEIIHVNYLRM